MSIISAIVDKTLDSLINFHPGFGTLIYHFMDLSESQQMEVLAWNPMFIQWLPDPSYKVQKMLIKSSPRIIRHIVNPHPEIIKLALNKNGKLLRFFEKTKENYTIAVNQNPYAVTFIDDPSYIVQCEIIHNHPKYIKYLKMIDPELHLPAIKGYPEFIGKVPNPTLEMIQEALWRDPMTIRFILFPTEEQMLTAVKRSIWAIEHIRSPTYEVQMYCIKRNILTFRMMLIRPHLDVYRFVISKNPNFLRESEVIPRELWIDLIKTNIFFWYKMLKEDIEMWDDEWKYALIHHITFSEIVERTTFTDKKLNNLIRILIENIDNIDPYPLFDDETLITEKEIKNYIHENPKVLDFLSINTYDSLLSEYSRKDYKYLQYFGHPDMNDILYWGPECLKYVHFAHEMDYEDTLFRELFRRHGGVAFDSYDGLLPTEIQEEIIEDPENIIYINRPDFKIAKKVLEKTLIFTPKNDEEE